MARFPWGNGPAPAHNCARCGRRIGKNRTHLVIATAVYCLDCSEQRDTHTVAYPDCPIAWHDVYDHGAMFATRARRLVRARRDAQPTHQRHRQTGGSTRKETHPVTTAPDPPPAASNTQTSQPCAAACPPGMTATTT